MTDLVVFLRRLTERLDAARVPYMLCGSVASGLHGEFRQTQDVVVVVDPTGREFAAFLRSLGPEFYVDEAAARNALERRDMFNVIDQQTLWKADIILRKDRRFDEVEFDRAVTVDYKGLAVRVASPEDVILSKLEWAKMSPSERQMRDAAGVAKNRWRQLDRDYLNRWASRLEVSDLLALVMRDAELQQKPGDAPA